MYTRQVIGSLAVSLGVGYLSLSFGYTGIVTIAAIALSYLVVRWSLASYYRIRYWLSRETQGVYSEYCPNCEGTRYRVSGDWILTCKKCGWRPGYIGLRWITRSEPAIQFRRSVSRIGAFVAGVAITVLLSSQPQATSTPSFGSPSVSAVIPNFPNNEQVALFGVLVLSLAFAILWALRPRQYYCKNCGQDLGRGDPPEKCPKCGSNRFTTEDPGVGKKVRLEQVK